MQDNGGATVSENPKGSCGASRISHMLGLVAVLTVLLTLVACGPMPLTSPTQSQAQAPAPLAPPQATPAVQSVYVAIGASDAFGIGTQDPATQAWPVVLARTLGTSYRLIDLGIPGATVDLATRDELPIALDAQPRIITVWLAVNDFDAGVPLATYAAQLRTLLHALVTDTAARVYVANIPDLSYIPYFASRDRQQLEDEIAAWNAAIAQDCDAFGSQGVTLVDLYAGWAELATHPEYISSDSFHPSAAGAARLAAIFASVILPAEASGAVAPNQQSQVGAP